MCYQQGCVWQTMARLLLRCKPCWVWGPGLLTSVFASHGCFLRSLVEACAAAQRKTPRSALRKGGVGGGTAGGRRKISFAEAPDEADEEGQDNDEMEPEDEDPIEDPDLAAPTSSAEV